MQRALSCARRAASLDEVPVGAALVREGTLVALSHNCTRSRVDPTAHAEILAIRSACQSLDRQILVDCDLFVTLEPCAMCAQAIAYARIRRLYYGAPDPKGGAVDHGPRIFEQPTCHHRPEVYSGLGGEQAASLLRRFFAGKR